MRPLLPVSPVKQKIFDGVGPSNPLNFFPPGHPGGTGNNLFLLIFVLFGSGFSVGAASNFSPFGSLIPFTHYPTLRITFLFDDLMDRICITNSILPF
jgi:hypothetical protein